MIDFGVAKATSQKLTERTLFTQFGQIVGRLEYMSPEQAECQDQHAERDRYGRIDPAKNRSQRPVSTSPRRSGLDRDEGDAKGSRPPLRHGYPQSNGKLERYHRHLERPSLPVTIFRYSAPQ